MLAVADSPLTCVVVVTWRGAAHITACLDALAAQERPHRTIVVDNASDDGTAALVAAHPSAPEVIRLPANTGYAGGLAAALPGVDTPFMAWLNDDATPGPGWLAALEDALLADDDAGAASALLTAADGTVQSAGVALTADGHGRDLAGLPDAAAPGSAGPSGEVFGFCGGACLVRTAALRAMGGVPAEFFCYYEDTDTSWRLRLGGWHVLTVAAATAAHRHGASSAPGSPRFHRWNERNRLLMLLRCAPWPVAGREVVRFALLTALLPLRRRRGVAVADTPNFATGLRLEVLRAVLRLAPTWMRARRALTRSATIGRGEVWRRWAGG